MCGESLSPFTAWRISFSWEHLNLNRPFRSSQLSSCRLPRRQQSISETVHCVHFKAFCSSSSQSSPDSSPPDITSSSLASLSSNSLPLSSSDEDSPSELISYADSSSDAEEPFCHKYQTIRKPYLKGQTDLGASRARDRKETPSATGKKLRRIFVDGFHDWTPVKIDLAFRYRNIDITGDIPR